MDKTAPTSRPSFLTDRPSGCFLIKNPFATLKPFVFLIGLLSASSLLYGHADDERSHQVITVIPDASGANIQFDLFCGPKLGRTLMLTLEMAKRQPELINDEFNPTLLALLEKRPWIEVRCGSLVTPSRVPTKTEPNISQKLSEHLKLFGDLGKDAIQRHQLFKPSSSANTSNFHWVDLSLLLPGRMAGSYFPTPEAGQENSPPKELLLLSFRYRFLWPKDFDPREGLTLTVDTNLKVFTSNSYFSGLAPARGTLLSDPLLKTQEFMPPEDFLLHLPSNKFKLRRGIFFYHP